MITALFDAIQSLSRSSGSRERSPSTSASTTGVATPIDAITTNTAYAIACSPASMPVCAIATAPATASSRFFGLIADRANPTLAALTAVN